MNLVSQTDGDPLGGDLGPIADGHEAAVRRRLLGDRADALDPLAEASA